MKIQSVRITPKSGHRADSGINVIFSTLSRAAQVVLTISFLFMLVLLPGCKDDLAGGMLIDCDLTPPLAGSISPTCESAGVALNQVISATFNEEIDPSTVNGATVTLTGPDAVAVIGVVSFDVESNIVQFTPSANLAPSTTYTYTIKGGSDGIQDLFENILLNDFTCVFTTGMAPDTSAPIITSTEPDNNMTGVALNSMVTATFNETMDPLTISSNSFVVLGPGSSEVTGSVTYAGPSFTAVFTPSEAFDPNTIYTATIMPLASDQAGNGLVSAYIWSFTTGAAADVSAPTVISTNPLDLGVDVGVGSSVTATFSEVMEQTSVSATSFIVSQGLTSVSGLVSFSGTIATFVPDSELTAGTTYTATILTDATDLAGNALENAYVWSFTTAVSSDAIAPTVMSTNPADLDINVALNSDVAATFSEEMAGLTITTSSFTLMDGLSDITGSVSYLNSMATFNPDSDLAANTTYTAIVSTDATDLAGNALENAYVWSFTTAATIPPSGPMAVNLACAENFSILAGSTITSTGLSIVNGDIAMSPGSALIGFPPGIINGTVNINDPTADDAKGCLTAGYNDAAGRAPGLAVSGNIGGLTLTPGVFTAGSDLAVSSGDLTLDAQGNADGVFIFQVPTSFTMTSGRQVILAGGAQAKNVFWQVGSSATIGTGAVLMGNVMADQAITLETGAVLNGSALARIAAVSLDAATINGQ